MNEMNGRHIIRQLRSKWVRYTLLADALLAAGAAFLMAAFTNTLFGWSFAWSIVYGAVVFATLFLLHAVWRVKEKDLAELLDQTYPQLEESSGLLCDQQSL